MKKIIHLSDLHFGTENKAIIDLLIADIQQLNPDLVVISGDFTQRALKTEFEAARIFLNALKEINLLCVPGNHDISFNPIERFFRTYYKYKNYISDQLNPKYCKGNLAVLGINSVNPYKVKAGIVTKEQLQYITKFFQKQPVDKIKILVMHHNLIRSERHKIIKNSEEIITTLAKSKVNLILAGHLHCAYIEEIKRTQFNHSMYVITAGTAISKRLWSQTNSFNILDLNKDHFKISVRTLNRNKFVTSQEKVFAFLK